MTRVPRGFSRASTDSLSIHLAAKDGVVLATGVLEGAVGVFGAACCRLTLSLRLVRSGLCFLQCALRCREDVVGSLHLLTQSFCLARGPGGFELLAPRRLFRFSQRLG